MDLSLRTRITGDLTSLAPKVVPQVMTILQEAITETINKYIEDLGQHMGRIPGDSDYHSGKVHWEKLDEWSLERNRTFWYETGESVNSIVAAVSVEGNRIRAFAGIPESSPAFKKALWNEFGFTSKSGEVVRRPLFMPLAEQHKEELNERLRNLTRTLKIAIEVNV